MFEGDEGQVAEALARLQVIDEATQPGRSPLESGTPDIFIHAFEDGPPSLSEGSTL